jgi:hypothetical protein
MRLCTWQRLERTDAEPNPAGVAYARAQIDAIAQAQKNGDLPAHFYPGFLLGLVLHLATGWVSVSGWLVSAGRWPRRRGRSGRAGHPRRPIGR